MIDTLSTMAKSCNSLFQQYFQQSILYISSAFGCIASESHPAHFGGKLYGIVQHDKMPYPVIPHLYQVSEELLEMDTTPQFILLCLIIIREFQNRGITDSLNLLIEYLPNNTSSLIDKRMIHEDIKLPSLIQCLKYSESCLVDYYVEIQGASLAKWFERTTSLDVTPEPKDVSDGIVHFIEEYQNVAKDLSSLFRVPVYKMLDEPIWILTPFSAPLWGEEYEMTIDQIFTNDNLMDTLSFDRDSLMSQVIYYSLKSMLEYLRNRSYDKYGFQQIQLDTSFIRLLLPIFLDQTQILDNLLLLIMQSAFDRSNEPEEMDNDAIVDICKAKYSLLTWN